MDWARNKALAFDTARHEDDMLIGEWLRQLGESPIRLRLASDLVVRLSGRVVPPRECRLLKLVENDGDAQRSCWKTSRRSRMDAAPGLTVRCRAHPLVKSCCCPH